MNLKQTNKRNSKDKNNTSRPRTSYKTKIISGNNEVQIKVTILDLFGRKSKKRKELKVSKTSTYPNISRPFNIHTQKKRMGKRFESLTKLSKKGNEIRNHNRNNSFDMDYFSLPKSKERELLETEK